MGVDKHQAGPKSDGNRTCAGVRRCYSQFALGIGIGALIENSEVRIQESEVTANLSAAQNLERPFLNRVPQRPLREDNGRGRPFYNAVRRVRRLEFGVQGLDFRVLLTSTSAISQETNSEIDAPTRPHAHTPTRRYADTPNHWPLTLADVAIGVSVADISPRISECLKQHRESCVCSSA